MLLLVGHALGSPVLVALMASLALGSTAFASLSSLGGSSPLIYTLFSIILIAKLVLRPGGLRDVHAELVRHPISVIILLLVVYTAGTALVLPRLFQGDHSAIVPVNGAPMEVPLAPVSGNITQPAYFALGALTCITLCIALREPGALMTIRRAFFAWVVLNGALGILDLLGKAAGAGDVLLPIRTANYSLLTDAEQSGFSRIAGGHPEASSFAAAMFAGLAFLATYWRVTQQRVVFVLTMIAIILLLLSTSTTAYACVGAYAALLGASAGLSLLKGHIRRTDLILAGTVLVGVTACLGIYLVDDTAFADAQRLFETTVLTKSQSASAIERNYFNALSLQTFFDTGGLGIGMGSSRASNWLIAVVSQIGIIGATLQLVLVGVLLRPPPRSARVDVGLLALHEGARAAGLASLFGNLVSGGSADPGVLFFICLATVISCRDALAVQSPANLPRLPASRPQAI
ncbi:hypothetical protein [Chelatococcus reniformis]|uniref:hypothetical protein n=1 Tax=Chelatococcus reniformis TaxID=1494448 RepID=UPI00166F5473|nr:hypothetical protein [Chelatococcus reniformis]